MLKRLISNDNTIKLIFDHYKNFAVAAVILAIGMSMLMEDARDGIWDVMRVISGSSVVFIGLFLVVINERHGMRKLGEANLNFFLHVGILLVYGMSMIAIVTRLVLHHFG